MGDEAKAKNKPFNIKEWTVEQRQGRDVPRQSNGFDCGMFVTVCADSIVNGISLNESSYSEREMPAYRMRLAKAILLGKLYNDVFTYN